MMLFARITSGRMPKNAVLVTGLGLLAASFLIASSRGAYAISPGQLIGIVWDALLSMFGGPQSAGSEHLVRPRRIASAAAANRSPLEWPAVTVSSRRLRHAMDSSGWNGFAGGPLVFCKSLQKSRRIHH